MILAIPMLFVSEQMVFGRDRPWFPGWLDRRGVKANELALRLARHHLAERTTPDRLVDVFLAISA